MISFTQALVENPLLLSALLAGFAASIISGVIGSYVVVKRIVFISGSIAHSVLGGMGCFLYLQRVHGVEWATPLLGALITAVLAALLIGWIQLHYKQREDTVIASIWAIGMAVGILFISQTPGYNVELNNFLIGNILWVSPRDLYLLLGLDVLTLIAVGLFHKRFQAICFDEDQAQLQGLSVSQLYLFLLVLTAVSTVLLIQVVGIVLVITMLTIPAAIANLYVKRLSMMMALGVVLCMLFSFLGIYTAYEMDWPAGASIALIAGAAYLLGTSLKKY